MKYIHLLFALLLTAFVPHTDVATAQDIPPQAVPITQSIRGTVVDLDTQAPLIGVNVIVLNTNPLKGTSSDVNGRFAITDVPVGRATLQVTYIGYEPLVLSDMLITAGKELVLALELQESVIETEGVVVVADEFEGVAVNEMATVSARSFSVEQTQRYAASISDPARMAQTFAGVTGGGDDLLNDIVVRGNAPKGLLWRLEGIEVPNPNHFGGEGASGGGVSMLSSSTLSRSDFFTGAFPAEYGNAASGVFDLFLRNGNAVKREYAFQIGVLGIDAAIEGPFSADYNGSFLINYRYSTLGVLNNFGVLPDESIQYQDLSFKFNFPTQKGNSFTLFGLGGDAQDIYGSAVADSTQWVDPIDDAINGKYAPRVGILGASYLHLLGPNTYLKAIGMISGERRTDDELLLIPSEDYRGRILEQQDTRNAAYRASLQLNHKFNARQTLQVGIVGSQLSYNLVDRIRDSINGPLINFLDQKGSTNMLNSHVQLKLRPSARLTLTPGVHYTYFAFNKNHSLEPRIGAAWRLSETQTLSFGVGLHTRTESTALYLAERTNAAG
ncbi:MAG: carboxypeptidase-like regulatory domain-containing protein, partial [Bacteroidota bacterium]